MNWGQPFRGAELRGAVSAAFAKIALGSFAVAGGGLMAASPSVAQCAAGEQCARAAIIEDSAKLSTDFDSAAPAWHFTGDTDGGTKAAKQQAGAGPVTVTPSADGFTARASSSTWRDNSRKELETRIEGAKSLSSKQLAVPKGPVRRDPKLDVWTEIDVKGIDASADSATRAKVGADYKASKSTTVGVAAERAERDAASGGAETQDEKLSAYVKFKAAPMLSVDTSTELTSRRSSAIDGAGAETDDAAAVIVSPKIGQSFALDEKTKVEPFVNYKRAFDISGEGGASDSAGAGVTLAEPDSYALSVTTDVENLSASKDQALSSKVQLKLPFP